jgi:hypothetical protein
MGFFGRLLGIEDASPRPSSGSRPAAMAPPSGDAQALDRYRYMVRTAPPETLEQAHAEAFAKLSPAQRQQVLAELAKDAPPAERAAIEATRPEDAQGLARVATRAEIRQPGTVERSLAGGGIGLGASLLSSFAMGFVGSMVAQSFFSALPDFGGGAEGEGEGATAQADDGGGDDYADDGGGDDFGGDFEV